METVCIVSCINIFVVMAFVALKIRIDCDVRTQEKNYMQETNVMAIKMSPLLA